MRAARLNEWGRGLELEDIPQPEPDQDQILVRVHAASINPFDTAVQAGYLQSMARTPMTLGTDFAGQVVAVGSNITHLKPGDEVYGSSPLGNGTFAEYTVVKPHEVVRKPQSIDMLCSAAAGLPSMAAWISLFDLAQVKGGERVLVHGVAGNVGGIVTQLARREGAYVYGTDIPEKAEHAQKLGVDRFIDARSERFENIVQDVDAVIDLIGGEIMPRCWNVLKRGGRYVTSLLAETPQEEPQRLGIKSMGLGAFPRADVLSRMAELIDSGEVQIFVNRVFTLDEVNEAMAYRMETRTPGKVIVAIM
jgi:NADPH:quinone reductase-like Zn-dependent oxidoreductase